MGGQAGKNSQIEILRAVAIIFTLYHHLPIVTLQLPGFFIWLYSWGSFSVGVDLFFVISGFVITRSLCASQVEYQVSRWNLMLAFWLKRAFRLLPLAWFWLLVTALVTVAFAHLPGAQEQEGFLLAPVLAAFLNVANLYRAYCYSPEATAMICDVAGYSGHYWSLSLEEQFYLFYPFLFFLVNRKLFVTVLCIAIVAQLFWARPFVSYGWHFRTDALFWGVLLGFLADTKFYTASAYRLLWYRHLLLAVMFFLLFLLPWVAKQGGGWAGNTEPWAVGVVAIVAAFIVLIASYDFQWLRKEGATQKILMYLGARSYSLYVTHFVMFRIFGYINNHWDIEASRVGVFSIVTLSLFSTLAASELSYRFIENRYRPKGRNMARQRLKAKEH